MGHEISVQTGGAMELASATPFSLTSLQALVPDWISQSLFDDGFMSLPQILPADGPRQLRDVADRIGHSLQDRPVRQFVGDEIVDGQTRRRFDDPLDVILGEMRLRTLPRSESDDETRARFRILREDCRKHATEVVREACAEYARSHKFFPAGIGELQPFITKAENARNRLRYHLRRCADEAEKRIARERAIRDDPVDHEEVRALVREMELAAGMKSADAKKRDYSNLRTPSPEELAALAAELQK